MPRHRTTDLFPEERFIEILDSLPDLIWPNVDQSGECWEWTKEPLRAGYGTVYLDGYTEGAHRAAWWLATRCPIPWDHMILHTCDNRRCVRNDEPGVYVVKGVVLPRMGHLALGTNLDNLRDASEKWAIGDLIRKKPVRAPRDMRGERSSSAKITNAQAGQIRTLYAETDLSIAMIGEQFGIGKESVKKIVRGLSYATESTVPLVRRKAISTGADRPGALLTWEQVDEIRRIWAHGDITVREVAETFSIPPQLAYNVVHNRSYCRSA